MQIARTRSETPSSRNDWSLAAAETTELGGVDAGVVVSAAVALPMFFVGWIALGVLAALTLVGRGHDTRTMIVLGAGLGPLMLVIASDGHGRRERSASPVVLDPGVDHGGPLDVLVLVQGAPDDVHSIAASLEAAGSELGTVTVARAVDFESVEGDVDLLTSADALALARAGELVPITGAAIALWPGTVDVVARRFRAERRRALVLVAIGDLAGRRSAPGSR